MRLIARLLSHMKPYQSMTSIEFCSKDCMRTCESADTAGCPPTGTIIMITRPYSRCSIGPRNCAPFARNSPTVVSIRRTSKRSSGDAGSRSLAFPFAVRRVHAHLARPRFENEPVVIEVLGDVPPSENITQKRPRCVRIVGVNQRMN